MNWNKIKVRKNVGYIKVEIILLWLILIVLFIKLICLGNVPYTTTDIKLQYESKYNLLSFSQTISPSKQFEDGLLNQSNMPEYNTSLTGKFLLQGKIKPIIKTENQLSLKTLNRKLTKMDNSTLSRKALLLQLEYQLKSITPENRICKRYYIYPTKFINGVWQSAKPNLENAGHSSSTNYLGYRAYFDDRDVDNVNILIFGSASWNVSAKLNTGLYCTQWYKSGDKYTIPVARNQTILTEEKHLPPINNQTIYPTHIRCPVVYINNQKPTHLSVSFERCMLSMRLPIIYPPKIQQPQSTAVCIPMLYDRIQYNKEAIAIVEWAEIYRLFGVTKFFFYSVNANFDLSVEKVFNYYQKLNVFDVTYLPPAVTNFNGTFGLYLRMSIGSLDDCLFRNMYSFKHIIIADLDDIFIPRLHSSFNALIEQYNNRYGSDFKAYNVFSVNYFLDFGPTKNYTDPLITSKYFYNTGIAALSKGFKMKHKAIINPLKCIHLWDHGCKAKLADNKKYFTFQAGVVSCHHYRRSCSSSYFGAANETKPQAEFREDNCVHALSRAFTDNYAGRLGPKVLPIVLSVIQELQLNLTDTY